MKKKWEDITKIPELLDDQVHIWRVIWANFKSKIAYFSRILSPEELERAERFKFPADRERSIITRGILRILLGNYLNLDPALLDFKTNDHGKPALKNPETLIHFNLSDSGEFALFAFVQNYEIGVDIEQIRPDIEVEEIAERFFSPVEIKTLLALSKSQRLRAFFNCWTRKEAFIKALGLGLSYGLDKFEVDFINDKGSLLLADREDFNIDHCRLNALDLDEDYVGAFAVIGENPVYNYFIYNLSKYFQCGY